MNNQDLPLARKYAEEVLALYKAALPERVRAEYATEKLTQENLFGWANNGYAVISYAQSPRYTQQGTSMRRTAQYIISIGSTSLTDSDTSAERIAEDIINTLQGVLINKNPLNIQRDMTFYDPKAKVYMIEQLWELDIVYVIPRR